MLKHNFDEYINRKNTHSYKWDAEGALAKYPMGCADTDFKVAKPIIDELHKKIDEGILAYGDGSLDEFSSSLSGYYKRRHKFEIDKKHILFAPGLMVALKLFCDSYTRPGDCVILQPPVYHSFKMTIEKAGRHVVENPLVFDEKSNSYEVNFKDLEEKAKEQRCRMMIVCNPHNPIAKVFKKEELEKIFDICKRNNVLVISDEVHSDIYYGDNKHTPFLSISEEAKNNAILMSADGKTFNIHSFYSSFIFIPNDYLRQQYELAFQYHHLDYNMLGCIAAATAYSKCDYYVDGLVKYVEENVSYVQEFLSTKLPSVKLTNPQATYLMWLNFKEWNLSSKELYKLFIEYDVVISAGYKFGTGGDGFMRMNIACHRDTLKSALEAIKKAYEERVLNR